MGAGSFHDGRRVKQIGRCSYREVRGMRRIDFPRAAWDSFLNVNTPAEREVARRNIGECECE
jgi:hypothetical protein